MRRVGRYLLGSALIVVGAIASFAYQDGYEMWKWGIFWFSTFLGCQLLLGPTIRRLWEKRNASLVARGLKPPPEAGEVEHAARR